MCVDFSNLLLNAVTLLSSPGCPFSRAAFGSSALLLREYWAWKECTDNFLGFLIAGQIFQDRICRRVAGRGSKLPLSRSHPPSQYS